MEQVTEIGRDRIAATEVLIRRYLRWTPLLKADLADFGLPGTRVIFKLEMLQHSGSFKARGAFAKSDPQGSLFTQPLSANRFAAVPLAPSGKPSPAPIELSCAEPPWLARTA